MGESPGQSLGSGGSRKGLDPHSVFNLCSYSQRCSEMQLFSQLRNQENIYTCVIRTWSNGNSHSLLVQTPKGSSAVSYKTEDALSIQASSHASWCLPKGVEGSCPHRNLQMDVYSGFIHNSCQNLGATEMPVSRWVGK